MAFWTWLKSLFFYLGGFFLSKARPKSFEVAKKDYIKTFGLTEKHGFLAPMLDDLDHDSIEFLRDANRSDWTKEDAHSARDFIFYLLEKKAFDEIAELPKHYWYFLKQDQLENIKNLSETISTKCAFEIERKAKG